MPMSNEPSARPKGRTVLDFMGVSGQTARNARPRNGRQFGDAAQGRRLRPGKSRGARAAWFGATGQAQAQAPADRAPLAPATRGADRSHRARLDPDRLGVSNP